MTSMSSSYQPLRITAIEEPIHDFRLFTLEPASGPPLSYQAGQYLTLVAPGIHQEVRRSYSMTSAPRAGEPLTIGVRRVANGYFSRPLFQLGPGAELHTSGVGGFFVLPAHFMPDQQVFFLAAGTGITPIYALLKTLLVFYPSVPVTLIYSNRSPEQTIFYREIMALAGLHSQFRVAFLHSVYPDLNRARLNPESLEALLRQHEARVRHDLFYVCGPESYMRMCLFTLRGAGVADTRIRTEHFALPAKTAGRPHPPDEQPHEVIIDSAGTLSSVRVQYPLTILDAALRQGVKLPYSCRSGICGNCAAHCVSGSVWMYHNQVLGDRELAAGLVLTCTGYPVGGDALLRFHADTGTVS